jgi:uncharacterized membrane protein YgcG
MRSFPDLLQTLLDNIVNCSKEQDNIPYLYGDSLWCESIDFLPKNVNIIVSHDESFDSKLFYQSLLRHVEISQEIEMSDTSYHVIAMGFNLKIDLVYQFDPTRLVEARRFGRFNIDTIFFDLIQGELRHPPEISNDVSTLINNSSEQWGFADILGFAEKVGSFPEITIDKEQRKKLENISLSVVEESWDTNWLEAIEDILLSRHPGSALYFMTRTFVDGMPWVFKMLADYVVSLDVPVNEDSTIETVFNKEKIDLVNLYNDYFLEKKNTFETFDEIHHRLTTTLKILFDSPNMVIPKPSTRRFRAMAAGELGRCCLGTKVGSTIVFVGCGENIEEEDCLGLPVFCEGGNPCLKEHSAFSHIPDNIWENITITNREWCPDQVCPDADNIHCLEEISSSSSSGGSSSSLSSSSNSSSSNSSSSNSSSSISSSGSSSSSRSSSSRSSSSSSSSEAQGTGPPI